MRNASPKRCRSNIPLRHPAAQICAAFARRAGYAVPTPVSDGQNVYVLFETGVVACSDLAGNRKWAVWTPMASTEHGCIHSPALVGDRLILGKFQFESVALDTKTGKKSGIIPGEKADSLWRGSVVTVKAGSETYFIEPGAENFTSERWEMSVYRPQESVDDTGSHHPGGRKSVVRVEFAS